MTNPTNPFNWQMPTASDLVTDLPADFETFGQAVATSMADLLGGTTGQVLSKASNTDMDFTWVTTDDANAIQNSIVDAKGDLIAASANDTPARLAVGNNGETLVADSSTSTGLRYQANFAAGKNKIINGDFFVNQRGFTSSTTNGTYNFDRFYQSNAGGTVTCSAQTFTTGAAPVAGYEGKNFVRLVSASQSSASDYAALTSLIESVRTLAGQTVTISFWAKASTGTPAIGTSILQAFGTGGSPSSNVITSASTTTITSSWARYSFTISLPSISGKTIGTNNNDKLQFNIWTSVGSTISGAGYPAVGLQNVTIDLWGVQLEAGSTATAFQTATGTIQGELAACQRYYYRVAGATAYNGFGLGQGKSTTVAGLFCPFPVTMRTDISQIEHSALAVFDGAGLYGASSATVNTGQSGKNSAYVEITTTGLTQYRPYVGLFNNNAAGYIGFSAEL